MAAAAREQLKKLLGEIVDEPGDVEAAEGQAGELKGACVRGVWRNLIGELRRNPDFLFFRS